MWGGARRCASFGLQLDNHPGARSREERSLALGHQAPSWPGHTGHHPPTSCPPAPTSPAGVHAITRSCRSYVQGKFSKLCLRLICPPSHPPASSEALRSLGAPLPAPPLPQRPLLPCPSFPGRQARPPLPPGNCMRWSGQGGCDRAALSGPLLPPPPPSRPPRAHSGSPPSLLLPLALA